MIKFGYFVATLILTAMAAGCGSSSSSNTAKQSPDTASYHWKAWHLRESGAPASEFIAMQQKAVSALNSGDSQIDPVEVLAQMGYFYNIVGNYRDGIDYLCRAAEAAEGQEPGEGTIQLYGNLGDLYVTLGMGNEALAANTKAIGISRKLKGRYLSDLYRFRATIFDLLDLPDSTMKCFDYALYAIDHGNIQGDSDVMRAAVLSERADYIITKRHLWPDSIDKAVKVLESLRDTEVWDIDGMALSLGIGYLAQGRVDEGISQMEEALNQFRRQEDTHGIAYCLTPLMDAYAANGRFDKLGENFREYAALRDTLLNREKLNAITGADISYRATRLKEANEMLRLRGQLERQRTIFFAIAGIALIIGLAVYISRQRNAHRRELKAQTERMRQLLSERIDLNARIECLNEQLKAQDTETKNKASFLQPVILEKGHEREFRHTFSMLYPNFLPDIRRDFPDLTHGNELVCMMIYLHKSTDEIALALGISRDSVNKTRYRLRQRFNLPREVDLDTFLRSR